MPACTYILSPDAFEGMHLCCHGNPAVPAENVDGKCIKFINHRTGNAKHA